MPRTTRKTTAPAGSGSIKKAKLADTPPLQWSTFEKAAAPLTIRIQGDEATDILKLDAGVKEFTSGSYGWSASKNAKIPLKGHKELVDMIISVNITVKGSKPTDATSATTRTSVKTAKSTGKATPSRREGADRPSGSQSENKTYGSRTKRKAPPADAGSDSEISD